MCLGPRIRVPSLFDETVQPLKEVRSLLRRLEEVVPTHSPLHVHEVDYEPVDLVGRYELGDQCLVLGVQEVENGDKAASVRVPHQLEVAARGLRRFTSESDGGPRSTHLVQTRSHALLDPINCSAPLDLELPERLCCLPYVGRTRQSLEQRQSDADPEAPEHIVPLRHQRRTRSKARIATGLSVR